MTFGLVYAFSESFVLPLSHDEVVYGKGSLIGKMPGDDWQKFANLRAYFGFMWTHPGKKLLFMGGEFAQGGEWNHDTGLDWDLLDDPRHAGVQAAGARPEPRLSRRRRRCTRATASRDGFRWVVIDDRDQSVFAYLRFGAAGDAPVLVGLQFHAGAARRLPDRRAAGGAWREVINTDAARYGGSNMGNGGLVARGGDASHGHAGLGAADLAAARDHGAARRLTRR